MSANPTPVAGYGGFSGYWVGNEFFLISPVQFLTQQYSSSPVRQSMKPYVPANAASFRVKAPLYRGVASTLGIVDVTGCCQIPPYVGQYNFDIFGGAYISGVAGALSSGTLVESVGCPVEIPNMRESTAPNDWGVFYWLHAGTTLPGAELTLQLLSYKMKTQRWPAGSQAVKR